MQLLNIGENTDKEKILVSMSCDKCIKGMVVFSLDISNVEKDETSDECSCGSNSYIPRWIRDSVHSQIEKHGAI